MATYQQIRAYHADRSIFDPRDRISGPNAWNGSAGADETDCLLACIADAAAVDGVVVHSGGEINISAPLVIQNFDHISMIGVPGSIIKAHDDADPFDCLLQITFDNDDFGFGNRFGEIHGIRWNGNRIAKLGWDIFAVQRIFTLNYIYGCTRAGLFLNGAQNCSFYRADCEQNGSNNGVVDVGSGILFPDGNIVVSRGAGNCTFDSCEMSPDYFQPNQGAYNLVICQDQAGPAGTTFTTGPNKITFRGCQMERSGDSNWKGSILHSAGFENLLDDCMITTDGSRSAVKMTRGDGVLSSRFTLQNCRIQGSTGGETGVEVLTTDGSGVIINGTLYPENLLNGFKCVNASSIQVNGLITWGNVTNRCVAASGGTKTEFGLMVYPRPAIAGLPSNSTDNQPPLYSGFAAEGPFSTDNNMGSKYNGAWRHTFYCEQIIQTFATSSFPNYPGVPTPGWPLIDATLQADFSRGDWMWVRITDNPSPGKILIAPPLKPKYRVGEFTYDFYNNSGGALTGANIVFSQLQPGGFILNSAAVWPDNGKHIQYRFKWDGVYWREQGTRVNNQPNETSP